MKPAGTSQRTVTCPACKGAAVFGPGNPWRPFCCQRCHEQDLGAWASEDFRLGTEPPDEASEQGGGLPLDFEQLLQK